MVEERERREYTRESVKDIEERVEERGEVRRDRTKERVDRRQVIGGKRGAREKGGHDTVQKGEGCGWYGEDMW